MTAIVGVLCSDGIVIGSDSAASFGFGNGQTIEQPAKKIHIIGDHIIVAGTGQVGMGQRFCHLVEKLYQNKELTKHDHIGIGKLFSQHGIQDFGSTSAPKGQFGCLVAFSQGQKFYLLELQLADFQPEFKTVDLPFVSLGCGQPITDPFLGFLKKVFFAAGPPMLEDGIFITLWALLHAIELNPGGVNGPVQIAILENTGSNFKAMMLTEDELAEHRANVTSAEEHLRNYKKLVGGAAQAAPIPSAPAPGGK
jgi:20S proteasome alpha/beta subunit